MHNDWISKLPGDGFPVNMEDRRFYVIVYDIVDDKRRLKMAKVFESLGERVQKSVFEAYLSRKEIERLKKRILKLIHEEEDSVRVYNLCEACKKTVFEIGVGDISEKPGVVIL